MTECRIKSSRHDEGEGERCAKAKRHDVEIPTADVDIKLAEKLDSCLKIGGVSKPRFLTNKAKEGVSPTDVKLINTLSVKDKLKPRNLSRDELKERLIKKYDSLVPELDPERHNVKVVKILTANESIELGKNQAKKQLERQLELNSVSGNQLAFKNGLHAFRFDDGYEMPIKAFTSSKKSCISSKLGSKDSDTNGTSSKSVRFADVENDSHSNKAYQFFGNHDETSSDSDCSTICE